MIPVVQPYLPPVEKYQARVAKIFSDKWLTNGGTNVTELENKLRSRFGVELVVCVSNGSLALQIIYKALGLRGEILTSPFSFVATTSTMVWEGLQPRFVDIDQSSLNLSPQYLERASFQNVSAVVSTHVYGNPSGATRLDGIAKDKDVPLIFDAAHAFGVDLNSESVFCVGDASAISFHATKIFHTAEGGRLLPMILLCK